MGTDPAKDLFCKGLATLAAAAGTAADVRAQWRGQGKGHAQGCQETSHLPSIIPFHAALLPRLLGAGGEVVVAVVEGLELRGAARQLRGNSTMEGIVSFFAPQSGRFASG